MARATLTVQPLTNGLAATYTAIVAADDAQYVFDPAAFLHVRNTTESTSIPLTIKSNETIDGDLVVPDRTITLAGGAEKFTAPLDKTHKQADGMVYLNSPTDGLEIAVLKVQ